MQSLSQSLPIAPPLEHKPQTDKCNKCKFFKVAVSFGFYFIDSIKLPLKKKKNQHVRLELQIFGFIPEIFIITCQVISCPDGHQTPTTHPRYAYFTCSTDVFTHVTSIRKTYT